MVKLLYVDDEEGNLNYFRTAFRREFDILLASSGAEGLEILKKHCDIPVILTDQRMPKMTGVTFLKKSREINQEALKILVTGFSDMDTVVNAINHGNIYYFIHKPWSYHSMRIVIQKALEAFQLRVENKNLQLKAEIQEKERLSSQLISLRNQVNPHFLFNCLNTLRAMVPGNDHARSFIQHLSSTYRYMLEHQEENTQTIQNELKFTKDYIYLQNVRFGEALIYDIKVPESEYNNLLPSGSIQLLVENALKHNAVSRNKPLTIEIFVDDCMIVVRNNYQTRNALEESLGIGQQNLMKRLTFFTDIEPEFYLAAGYYYAKLPILRNHC